MSFNVFCKSKTKEYHTFLFTTLLSQRETMLFVPLSLFKTFSIRFKKSSENVSWNICSAFSIIVFSLLSEWNFSSVLNFGGNFRKTFLEEYFTFLKSLFKKSFLYPLNRNLLKNLFFVFKKLIYCVEMRTYLRNSPRTKLRIVCF